MERFLSTTDTTPGPAPRDFPRPLLRIVPVHEHLWELRAVEYDDNFSVTRFECDCGSVRFT